MLAAGANRQVKKVVLRADRTVQTNVASSKLLLAEVSVDGQQPSFAGFLLLLHSSRKWKVSRYLLGAEVGACARPLQVKTNEELHNLTIRGERVPCT